VRLTHIETGIIVRNQEERDQTKNYKKAMEIMEEKLLNLFNSSKEKEILMMKKSQSGTGDLNEKIRTYNWPGDRITDHRINKTLYGINKMLQGKLLEEFLDELIESEKQALIASLIEREEQEENKEN